MSYTDFNYYVEKYCGTKVTNIDEFDYYVKKASATLKHYTMGRITESSEEVQDCCCALIDYLCKQEKLDENDVASESLANHSISYRGSSDATTKASDIKGIIKLYLGYSKLLYSGFNL